jgi:hypothetical protein
VHKNIRFKRVFNVPKKLTEKRTMAHKTLQGKIKEDKSYSKPWVNLGFSKQFKLAEEKVGNNLFDKSKYIIRSMFFAASKEATEPRVPNDKRKPS